MEVYSIDESFLDFGGFRDREAHAQEMRKQVLLQIGVPVRVGIGPTKTLAKCANEVAKRNPIFKGVLDMMDQSVADWVLPRVQVGDIWGVGGENEGQVGPPWRPYGGGAARHAGPAGQGAGLGGP